jgi:prevent-host-death family protein
MIEFNITLKGLSVEITTLLEFRRHADAVIRKVRQGKRLILTHHGKPVMRLEPIQEVHPAADDPFYTIGRLAVSDAGSLTNEEIDQILYPAKTFVDTSSFYAVLLRPRGDFAAAWQS